MLVYAVTFPLSIICLLCGLLPSDTLIDGYYLHAFVSGSFLLAISMACLLRDTRVMDKVMSEPLNCSFQEITQSVQSMSKVPHPINCGQALAASKLTKGADVNIMAAFISLYVMQVSHAAAQQGQVRDRLGGLLLEALIALPDLAGTLGLSNGWLYFPVYCELSARHHILHELHSIQ